MNCDNLLLVSFGLMIMCYTLIKCSEHYYNLIDMLFKNKWLRAITLIPYYLLIVFASSMSVNILIIVFR